MADKPLTRTFEITGQSDLMDGLIVIETIMSDLELEDVEAVMAFLDSRYGDNKHLIERKGMDLDT